MVGVLAAIVVLIFPRHRDSTFTIHNAMGLLVFWVFLPIGGLFIIYDAVGLLVGIVLPICEWEGIEFVQLVTQ